MNEQDALLAVYDAVLFDLDGTVYQGTEVIPGAPDVIRDVRAHGTAVRFVTNNASKAPEEVVAHLVALDITAEASEIETSAQAAVAVLRDRLPVGAEVLVVGTESLSAEVSGAGLTPVRVAGKNVAAVVQGHSPDTCWNVLAEACLAIRAGALWVACNVDATLPSERGLLPGNGSMVAVLRTATETEPVVAGKPSPPLFETAAKSAGAGKPLVVGDRLDTDIAGAVAAGMDALAVLTGVATPASLLVAIPAERPRYLAADVSGLRDSASRLEIGPGEHWQVAVEGDDLVVSGQGGDALELLRALCHVAWESGASKPRADGEQAAAALAELGLGTA